VVRANHFVPLYSIDAGSCGDSAGDIKDELTSKPVNGNRQSSDELSVDAATKQSEEGRDSNEKTMMDPGESNKKTRQSCDKGITKATKRGCLEQFGFFRQSSS